MLYLDSAAGTGGPDPAAAGWAMRVIAGTLKGMTIHTPRSGSVRPTYDRVRESVFGIIGGELPESRVLDLFAGSGSLGIECLSRGSRAATFVEIDSRVLSVLRENVERLGVADRSTLVRGDVLALLERAALNGPFDVVFVDPPYGSGSAVRALELLGDSDIVGASGTVVVERESGGDAPPDVCGRLARMRSRRYGTTTVDFYEVRVDRAGRKEEA